MSEPPAAARSPAIVLGAAAVTGLAAALVAIAFRAASKELLLQAYGAGDVVTAISQIPRPLRALLGAVTGGIAALVFSRLGGPSARSGTGAAARAINGESLGLRATLADLAGAFIALAGGLSLGREGPLLHGGAYVADAASKTLAFGAEDRHSLVAAGTAAGFAAAYNTPFAAVLFVVEVLAVDARARVVVPAVVATAVSTAATRFSLGGGPIYGMRAFVVGGPADMFGYAVLGVASGLVGIAFRSALDRGKSAFDRAPKSPVARGIIGGLVGGTVSAFVPFVAGNGFEGIGQVLGGSLPIAVLGVWLVAKTVATSVSTGARLPGGVFTPTLFLGATLGNLVGRGLDRSIPYAHGAPGGYALVGMAAVLAATTHAPLCAAVLVFELSGDYPIVLPLLVATSLATAVARGHRSDSLYAAER